MIGHCRRLKERRVLMWLRLSVGSTWVHLVSGSFRFLSGHDVEELFAVVGWFRHGYVFAPLSEHVALPYNKPCRMNVWFLKRIDIERRMANTNVMKSPQGLKYIYIYLFLYLGVIYFIILPCMYRCRNDVFLRIVCIFLDTMHVVRTNSKINSIWNWILCEWCSRVRIPYVMQRCLVYIYIDNLHLVCFGNGYG